MSATNGEALVSAINRLLVRLDAQGVSANEIVACIKPLIADSEAAAVQDAMLREYGNLCATNESLAKERDQLRAEVERLKHGTVAQFKDAFIDELTREVSLLIARAERAEAELTFQQGRNSRLFEQRDAAVAAQEKAEAELAKERARLDDLVADINDACITLASATDDCDDYALLNTRCKLTAVRDVLIQYIPPAEMKEGK
jgi:cell division protein FtsB